MEKLGVIARFAGVSIERALFRWPVRKVVAFSRLMMNLQGAEARAFWRSTPPRSSLGSYS
ncbi:hypothetical protein KAU45_09550 [bacterium]|nr:hypothetical protein [bacterium]